jgi:hypothetical protein
MTDANDAVTRISEKMSHCGPASWVDVAELLDRLEAAEKELARVLSQSDAERKGWRKVVAEAGDTARMRYEALEEVKTERDKLREELESARLVLEYADVCESLTAHGPGAAHCRDVLLERLGEYKKRFRGRDD